MTTKTDRLIREFGQQIAQGHYAPGSPLPSEAELCEKFDTSRNVMREVIKVLATKRLIDAQRHRGLFVMPRQHWNFLDADVLQWALEEKPDPNLIRSLIEVRSLIEPVITRWAAERATARDLVAMEESLKGMQATTANKALFMEHDIAFHRAVLHASHNVVIEQLSDAISALQRAIFDHTYLSEPENMALTLQEHGAIFDLIRQQNAVGAEESCVDMVSRTARRAHIRLDEPDPDDRQLAQTITDRAAAPPGGH